MDRTNLQGDVSETGSFSPCLPGNTLRSATETNRLMLFGETVTVYCVNHTEHINPVRTSQETHYVSATQTSRLMLFKETVAVY
jgi:hypothetical protein